METRGEIKCQAHVLDEYQNFIKVRTTELLHNLNDLQPFKL